MRAYYNEHDPFAAAWLRELIKAGHITPGDVDERSIEDVCATDLAGYVQCHFFAGIGVWSHALRLAGWSDNRAIWTASCPCQPFSAAGKGAGFIDERHLWPAFFDLMQQCDPTIAIGEQVASKDGLAWLDLVRADVEGTGRSFAASDLCAAGFGAPHIRQRSFWMAHRARDGRRESGTDSRGIGSRDNAQGRAAGSLPRSATGGLGDARSAASERDARAVSRTKARKHGTRVGLNGGEPVGSEYAGAGVGGLVAGIGHNGAPPTNGFWADADWLGCRDGKWRPVEPGSFPLAHGATNRVGRLRGYGNAIVAPVAQGFIESVMSIISQEA